MSALLDPVFWLLTLINFSISFIGTMIISRILLRRRSPIDSVTLWNQTWQEAYTIGLIISVICWVIFIQSGIYAPTYLEIIASLAPTAFLLLFAVGLAYGQENVEKPEKERSTNLRT